MTDLLPAAWYSAADRGRVPRRHRLLGVAILVIAVGFSLTVPVTGAIVVTAAVTVLRAIGWATESHADRRLRHGRRPRDPFVLVASVPWMLAWAVVETVLVAALVLLFAVIAVAAGITLMGARHPALATAAVAGVYAFLICVGPRSRIPRRQLNRFLDPVARTPLTAATVALMLGAVTVGLISLTIPGRPALWPSPYLRAALIHLTGTEPDACVPPPPAMRLTTLCAAPHGPARQAAPP